MFIEFKDLKKKRNIALLIVIFLIFSGGYLVVNNKGNIQRVESAIYDPSQNNGQYFPLKIT